MLPPPQADAATLLPPSETTPSTIAVAFARLVRLAGVPVSPAQTIDFARGLAIVGLTDRTSVYWTGYATMVRNPSDVELYDRAFAVFFEHAGATAEPDPETLDITLVIDTDDGDGDDPASAPPADEPTIELRFSATEVLRDKDFAEYSDEELQEAQHLMARLRFAGEPRRSARLEHTHRRTARPDIRATVRAALRTAGEPIERHSRTPTTRNRRLVLLLDISGSMEPYSRALLRFVHAAVAGRQRVEAFAFGTRLTRITREMASRDPDEALRQASARLADFGGGTRLGDALKDFNDRWGQRGLARGAIVVILSDGWDRGDPDLLGEQMQRLHRASRRLIWVNPLKVTPGYAPLARGMAAALPYVDSFVEGHSLAALEELARKVSSPD